jgi:AraC-like DNA-binding protein
MKTEIVLPMASNGQWEHEPLARLDESARKLEDALNEWVPQEDVLRAIARLSVPNLADYCLVDVLEGEQTIRSVFAHREPRQAMDLGPLLDHKAPLSAFAEGRRALAGEPVLMRFTAATFRPAPMRTPEMREIARRFRARSSILYPFVVLGTTVAVAAFGRTADTGLIQGPEELALAREMSRRAILRHAGLSAPRFTRNEDARLRRVDDFLRGNLGAPISLQAMAHEAALSRFHLLRLFKQAYGETPFRRLARLRMEEAQRRLLRGNESVTEIAFACGYENPAHFASAFRRSFGISPRAFRRLSR